VFCSKAKNLAQEERGLRSPAVSSRTYSCLPDSRCRSVLHARMPAPGTWWVVDRRFHISIWQSQFSYSARTPLTHCLAHYTASLFRFGEQTRWREVGRWSELGKLAKNHWPNMPNLFLSLKIIPNWSIPDYVCSIGITMKELTTTSQSRWLQLHAATDTLPAGNKEGCRIAEIDADVGEGRNRDGGIEDGNYKQVRGQTYECRKVRKQFWQVIIIIIIWLIAWYLLFIYFVMTPAKKGETLIT
jgi:hypothetical protein